MNYQPKISKLFKRGLLLPKYFNIYIPNITSVKINSKNPYLRKSNDNKYKGTLMKAAGSYLSGSVMNVGFAMLGARGGRWLSHKLAKAK